MSRVLSIGTALPQFDVSQAEAAEFALRHFNGRLAKHSQLMQVFPNTRIARRHFVVPLEWFETSQHSWQERNAIYLRSAEALSIAAAREALARAGISPHEVIARRSLDRASRAARPCWRGSRRRSRRP